MLDWSEKSILYIAAVDPSSPNGPGVNEREFINTLFERFDARCHAVFVAPAKDLPEAALWRYSVVKPVSRQNPLSFLKQQRDLYQCGARLIKEESPEMLERYALAAIRFPHPNIFTGLMEDSTLADKLIPYVGKIRDGLATGFLIQALINSNPTEKKKLIKALI